MSSKRVEQILRYGLAMVNCYETMLTPTERSALHAWEDGPYFTRTDDWPGWIRHIGPRPGAQLGRLTTTTRRQVAG